MNFMDPRLPGRFWSKCTAEPSSGCWPWTAGLMGGKPGTPVGEYGAIRINGRNVLAHRMSWEAANGRSIPAGLTVDHLCKNKRCVNPAHLEVVTRCENTRRHHRDRALCRRGHETADSFVDKRGRRQCRECKRIVAAVSNAKRRGLVLDPSDVPPRRRAENSRTLRGRAANSLTISALPPPPPPAQERRGE